MNIWITPPIAPEPYNADAGPRTTSIRSIADSGRCSTSPPPLSGLSMRMPSTSTIDCELRVPRTNSPDTEPAPPVCEISMPPALRSSSGSAAAPASRITCASITVMSASARSIVVSVRVAVTTTGFIDWEDA